MVRILQQKISQAELVEIAKEGYGSVVKLAVDIGKEKISLGGEFHSDCEAALVEDGSELVNIWGANIYLDRPKKERLEFIALINIRPAFNNRFMEIQDIVLKEKIQRVVDKFIE